LVLLGVVVLLLAAADCFALVQSSVGVRAWTDRPRLGPDSDFCSRRCFFVMVAGRSITEQDAWVAADAAGPAAAAAAARAPA
jgi:hypothetical protein